MYINEVLNRLISYSVNTMPGSCVNVILCYIIKLQIKRFKVSLLYSFILILYIQQKSFTQLYIMLVFVVVYFVPVVDRYFFGLLVVPEFGGFGRFWGWDYPVLFTPKLVRKYPIIQLLSYSKKTRNLQPFPFLLSDTLEVLNDVETGSLAMLEVPP